MRKICGLALAGLGMVAGASPAMAGGEDHIVRVRLPDGSIQQVRYRGNVPPRVVVVPVAVRTRVVPVRIVSPSVLAQIAMIDMQRRNEALRANAARDPRAATNGKAAPGVVRYSYVQTSTAGGVTCGRSVETVSAGANAKPKTITRSFGDCSAVARAAAVPQTNGKPLAAPQPGAKPKRPAPPARKAAPVQVDPAARAARLRDTI